MKGLSRPGLKLTHKESKEPMGLWSRKVVGYHAGESLEAEGRDLKTALRELSKGAFPARHSDRGCQ